MPSALRRLAALLALLGALLPAAHGGSCRSLNSCSGNGVCDTVNSKCNCFNGWGSASDVALYKAPDCSQRTCPASNAWVDVPTGAHTAHAIAECSNAGLCDRTAGRCRCFVGYEGEACQRSVCPGTPPCSNQGKCLSLKNMASEANAEPVGPPASYGGSPATSTWDENMIHGCVCDSTWSVGFGAGQTQAVEYTGPDCSQRRCPSGDDPNTPLDETDCAYASANGEKYQGVIGSDGVRYGSGAGMPPGVTAAQEASGTPGYDVGAAGNLCYLECSRHGTCDYALGQCKCFTGYGGVACSKLLSYQNAKTGTVQ